MAKSYETHPKTAPAVPPSKPSKPKEVSDYPRIHWLSVSFTPQQKAAIREQEFDTDKMLDNLAYMVAKGCKLVVNPKTSQGFVGVSIIGHTDECPYKGVGLSGEGGSFHTALRSLCAKLDILGWELWEDTITDELDFR
jgi:hypothetical protein